MIADFYRTFDEVPDKGSDIPQEVLDILSQDLPSNFTYYKNDDGEYMAGPSPEYLTEPMILRVDIDEKFVAENLKNIPRDKWAEYIYRMQLRVPVTSVRIGDKDKQIPIEHTLGNPLRGYGEIKENFMYPEPFPPAREMVFETIEGDKIFIHVKRIPHASFDEILFQNIDFPALQIQFTLADNRIDSKVKYTCVPQKATTVSDAVAAIHIFNGFYNGTVKIDGQVLGEPVLSDLEYDKERFEQLEEFWTTARKLEMKLGVEFIPSADFPTEDVVFFSELERCLLEDKSVEWEHPFDHFHVSGMVIKEGKIEDLFGEHVIDYVFQEGPMHATLLGAEFYLYSQTQMTNMIMTNIVWDDDEKKSGEIYVSDPLGSKWKLSRKYMTKEQMESLRPEKG